MQALIRKLCVSTKYRALKPWAEHRLNVAFERKNHLMRLYDRNHDGRKMRQEPLLTR